MPGNPNDLPPPDLGPETPVLRTLAPANFNQAIEDYWASQGGVPPPYSSEGDSGPNLAASSTQGPTVEIPTQSADPSEFNQAVQDYWSGQDSLGESSGGANQDGAQGGGGSNNISVNRVNFQGQRFLAPGGDLSPGMAAYYGMGGGYGLAGLSSSAMEGGDVASHSEGGAPSLGTEGGGIGVGTRSGINTGEISDAQTSKTQWENDRAGAQYEKPGPPIGWKWQPYYAPSGPMSNSNTGRGNWVPIMAGEKMPPGAIPGTTPPPNMTRK